MLLRQRPSSADLLEFYLEIAGLQKRIYDDVDSAEVACLVASFPELLRITRRFAPELGDYAAEGLPSDAARLELLTARWEGRLDELDPRSEFLAAALLQPFAAKLAVRGQVDANWTEPVCPFCGAPPALTVLRGEGEGGKRSLLCSLCSTEWNFRRILCPNCGEEDKTKLPVYVPATLDYVRVEACDSCKTYLKSIDLTKNGLADPVVDEIATVELNIWAETQGYVKLAANVMGM